MLNFSIVIPAKNESLGLQKFLPELKKAYPDNEIILVDDGSEDDTASIAESYGVNVIRHPYSKGNGASIKTGARAATGDYIVFMDGDGQHKPSDIKGLIEQCELGFDMVVGARTGLESQANVARGTANLLYNRIASWVVERKIEDLTSGFRIVEAKKFREFLHLLPNGFSYPTTITMSFFRAGYSVAYMPIYVEKRLGKSHLKPWKDGVRFLLIIFKVATLYSPLKLFFPISVFLFLLGVGRYAYTYSTSGTFTNMSALLMVSALTVFLMGMISEQITNLSYIKNEKE
jgi:glycosyltransferase involved in cell wall biosynthesis